MQIKTIQTALKNAGFNMTQKDIMALLERLKIEYQTMDNSQVDSVVNAVKGAQNQLTVSNGKSNKVTLKLPDEVQNVAEPLPTEETNKGRQEIQVNEYGQRMLGVANSIADNNAEMAVQLPGLVKQLTLTKLSERSEEIQQNWDSVNNELCEIMFGL